ncbi:MAG: glycosyltransferase family 4 protein, partial [Owenweeksia sp.]
TNIQPGGALINLLSGDPYHVSRFAVKEFEQKLIEYLQTHQYDVIQLEGLAMAVYLQTIRKYSSAPVSLRAHNVEYMIWQRHLHSLSDYFRKQYLKIQVGRLRKFEEEIVRQVDFLIPITEVDLQQFQTLNLKARTLVIPCGINLRELQPQKTEARYDLTYLASFDWPPNVQGLEWFLKKVWPHILHKLPNATFAVGGRDLPGSIARMQLPGFTFTGPVKSMPDFISQGKVVVIPLLAGSGMRIKIVENMALAKAMVSTSVGAEGIMVENGTDIILADDPGEFADKVVNLLKSQGQRQQIEKAARSKVEDHYDTFKLGHRLLNFYAEKV